jgi:hypothetical protein
MPLLRFLPPDDPRIRTTDPALVNAVMHVIRAEAGSDAARFAPKGVSAL